jgi:putative transposase
MISVLWRWEDPLDAETRVSRGSRHSIRENQHLGRLIPALAVNESWSMDFVSDCLGDGRQFRPPTVVDDFVKRCPVLEVDTSLSGERVTR